MKFEAQLKLQAYRDGELSEAEAAEVRNWLGQDAEARSLLAELENTSNALSGHGSEFKLAESREFYWSKIEREILRLEEPAKARAAGPSWRGWLRQQFAPLAGLASLAVVLGLLVAFPGSGPVTASSVMELASDEMGSHTFRDQEQRMTVVWLEDRTQESEGADPLASFQSE